MRLKISLISILMLVLACAARESAMAHPVADGQQTNAASQDIVLRAFQDELARTRKGLVLGNYPPPYFASYTGKEIEQFVAFGSFGALNCSDTYHFRTIHADVRVGDHKFDSSNCNGAEQVNGFEDTNNVPEDNYDAIRHRLWLLTDSAYKKAIEDLETKKATLQKVRVVDLPDSMSEAKPVNYIGPRMHLELNKEQWNNTIREVSREFKAYPRIVKSGVMLVNSCSTRWFANTEGSSNRESDVGFVVTMVAEAQAKDEMKVSDFEMFAVARADLLPDEEHLKMSARRLAERVIALADAPTLDDYRGPVLFEKQAAAEVFSQTLTPALVNPQGPSFNYGIASGELSEKLGRRILPVTMSVVDDPLAVEYNGHQLKGGYRIDDEGAQAQRVVLVKDGILKTLLSGRTPSKYMSESNGHWRDSAAMPNQLFITSTEGLPVSALKQKLIEIGKQDGLEYVLISRRIGSLYLNSLPQFQTELRSSFSVYSSGQLALSAPILLYRVSVADGSEQLVRGARFEHLTSRTWRDIVAVGDDPEITVTCNSLPTVTTSTSIVSPSILVSEVDLTRQSQQTDQSTLLKNPYFEKSYAPDR